MALTLRLGCNGHWQLQMGRAQRAFFGRKDGRKAREGWMPQAKQQACASRPPSTSPPACPPALPGAERSCPVQPALVPTLPSGCAPPKDHTGFCTSTFYSLLRCARLCLGRLALLAKPAVPC